MSTNLDGIVSKIRDVRAKKRPVIEANMQKIDKLLAALRDTRGKASTVSARYPDLAATLQGTSFNDVEKRLLEACSACETALIRLRRDNINLYVIGRAKQGKTQLLQTLTGHKQPPSVGDAAAWSIVRNDTAHPSPLPQGISVYELWIPDDSDALAPLSKILASETDIAFLVHRPQGMLDDGWTIPDLNMLNMLMCIYPQNTTSMKDWIQLILNCDNRTDLVGEKGGMSQKLYEDLPPIICDCASEMAVRKMLEPTLVALLEKVEDVDNGCMRQCDEIFRAARSETDRVRGALFNIQSTIEHPDAQSDLKSAADNLGD